MNRHDFPSTHMEARTNSPATQVMSIATLGAVLLLLCLTFTGAAMLEQGADYDLSWHKIAGGGETFSTGGGYELGGTIGQHDAGVMSSDSYELAGGFWGGAATTSCRLADLNCDGSVDGADLLILLSQWGECADPNNCLADLNNDGFVDGADLLILLSNWG